MSAEETPPCEIVLMHHKVAVGVALVDPDLYAVLAAHTWLAHSLGYAFRSHSKDYARHHIYMHREVLRLRDVTIPPGHEVDHINQNKSDNRFVNLRVVTRSENMHNTGANRNSKSGIRGVHRHSDGKKWVAQIKFNQKARHLGLFDTPEAAAEAYAAALATRRETR